MPFVITGVPFASVKRTNISAIRQTCIRALYRNNEEILYDCMKSVRLGSDQRDGIAGERISANDRDAVLRARCPAN
jgi:hypothetical protein